LGRSGAPACDRPGGPSSHPVTVASMGPPPLGAAAASSGGRRRRRLLWAPPRLLAPWPRAAVACVAAKGHRFLRRGRGPPLEEPRAERYCGRCPTPPCPCADAPPPCVRRPRACRRGCRASLEGVAPPAVSCAPPSALPCVCQCVESPRSIAAAVRRPASARPPSGASCPKCHRRARLHARAPACLRHRRPCAATEGRRAQVLPVERVVEEALSCYHR